MAAPADDDEDYEICNDDGFVYKRRRGLYPDDPPTSVLAAGPDPEALRRRRRRRALRRLLEERRRELASWEALDAKVQALQTAPVPPPPQAPPESPGAAATDDPPASSSVSPGAAAATVVPSAYSFLDDINALLDVREEVVKDLARLCKEFEALRSAHIAGLPVWGDPVDLGSLQSPDAPRTSSHSLRNESSFYEAYLNQVNEAMQRCTQVEIAIHAFDDEFQEAAGMSPQAVQMIKDRGKTMTEGLGHDPSTPSENRKKKRVATPHSSRSVKKPKSSWQSTPNPASSRLRHTSRATAAKMHN